MVNEGYQPNKGKLDSSNPPKGGSGVSNKEAIDTLKEEVERLKDWTRMQEGYLSKPTKTEIYRGKLLQIISSLLKQGEAYKAMFKSVKSAKINDKTIQKAIRILIKGIEEGYKNNPLPEADPEDDDIIFQKDK